MELTILILLLPFLSFLILGIGGKWMSHRTAGAIGTLILGAVAVLSYVTAFQYFSAPRLEDGTFATLIPYNFTWLPFTETLRFDLGILLDPISVMMLIVISTVSLMVHIYSFGYMKGETGFQRYYAFLSLFTMSMLGLVVATNIFQMYLFWELVGVSSYLLIGFYYTKPAAIAASKKAFIVTRFADGSVEVQDFGAGIPVDFNKNEEGKDKMSDVVCEVIAQLPTKYGTFEAHGYVDQRSGEHHVALVKGDIADGEPVLCRVHSECLTGDTFGSLRCDCGEQRSRAMRQIEKEGRGVFLYMRQEGRGIGLINKLKAYVLQEQGMDTVEANLALGFKDDERDYSAGAMILQDLGIKKLRLMTNNPTKIDGLNEYGLEIVERVPIQMPINPFDKYYMQTKQKKMGHMTTYEV